VAIHSNSNNCHFSYSVWFALNTDRPLAALAGTWWSRHEGGASQRRQAAAHDEQVGSSRSKRAQIRDVLRQYERGSLKEPDAVEELLKILR
jgi:hypothetical protein